MKNSEFAMMISRTVSAFAIMARTMMDDQDAESESFSILVQIDKDCQRLADDMQSLSQYAATWGESTDEERTALLKSFFNTGEADEK